MIARALSSIILVGALVTCGPADRGEDARSSETVAESPPRPPLVEVTARDFAFDAPDEIPSGWTTFRMRNVGGQEHFLYLWRLPDDVTWEQYQREIQVPFDSVWNEYAAGKIDRLQVGVSLGAALPAWIANVTPAGGPGLTEPGATSQATVRLEPGTYVMECYVKTPDGQWHTFLGMARRLMVTHDSTDAVPPEADAQVTLTNYEITSSAELTAGERTIAIHVEENPEGFLMHDVHLIRLDGDASLDEVAAWMDWLDLEQLRAPAPGYSLGGLEHMVAGRTGYVTVDLTPGEYGWVSLGYGPGGMVRKFTVQ